MNIKKIDDKNFKKIKSEAEMFYKKIGKIKCPYFNDDVSFNSAGLEHLKFKSKRKIRERKDAFMRLKNIYLAPQILKLSRTLQEKQIKNIFVNIKTNKRKEKVLKRCTYYGFVAIVKDGSYEKRLKIIVRQIEGGSRHFWSIIPFWKSNKEIKLHFGNMETD
jgi:hypothetical protein